MKKVLVVALALSFFASSAFAIVSGGKHDLSTQAWNVGAGGGAAEICIVCHTPHNARVAVPLWNRNVGDTVGASFTAYSSVTMDAAETVPSGFSLMCLSCHDGVTSLDSYVGGSNTSAAINASAPGNFGTNLADDHPISVVYSASGATDSNELKGATANNMGTTTQTIASFLEGGSTVECTSCHDVHASGQYMLVTSNADSALCVSCHIK